MWKWAKWRNYPPFSLHSLHSLHDLSVVLARNGGCKSNLGKFGQIGPFYPSPSFTILQKDGSFWWEEMEDGNGCMRFWAVFWVFTIHSIHSLHIFICDLVEEMACDAVWAPIAKALFANHHVTHGTCLLDWFSSCGHTMQRVRAVCGMREREMWGMRTYLS